MTKIVSIVFLFYFSSVYGQSNLTEIENFGMNPGNLRMFVHIPQNLNKKEKVPVVVALHGCSQNAERMAEQSGWNQLADKYNFIVLYPEQKRMNNTSGCFNWFMNKDIDAENGETASIKEMIDYSAKLAEIDSSRVFIYGLSAGAAMSVSLMVNFPCTFSSGAIYAGGPFGYGTNAIKGLKMMTNPPDYSPEEWGKLLPNQGKFNCAPRLIVLHGTEDNTVDFQNAYELIDQWSAIHKTDATREKTEDSFISNQVQRITYKSSVSEEAIILYKISGMGHALAVDPGNGETQGGKTGVYSDDIDFFSTYYIAKDFGLIE